MPELIHVTEHMSVWDTSDLDFFGQTRENPNFLGFYVERGAITRKEEKKMARMLKKTGYDLKAAALEVLYKTRGYAVMQRALEEKVLNK